MAADKLERPLCQRLWCNANTVPARQADLLLALDVLVAADVGLVDAPVVRPWYDQGSTRFARCVLREEQELDVESEAPPVEDGVLMQIVAAPLAAACAVRVVVIVNGIGTE